MARTPAQATENSRADTILASIVGNGDQQLAIRERVRRLFDEAVHSTRSVDAALVLLYTKGIEAGIASKRPHRKTQNGAQAQASE